MISSTTTTGLENTPAKVPATPASVFTWESSVPTPLRREIQVPAPPPMVLSTFSGPTLEPPISDTTEAATVPGTNARSTCSACSSANTPGISSGRWVRRRSRPTTTPAAAVTATHHQCPPNQPGWESVYHLPPNLITPMRTRPANAPNTPRATAYPIRTQNSRFSMTGGAAAGPGMTVTTRTSPKRSWSCRQAGRR